MIKNLIVSLSLFTLISCGGNETAVDNKPTLSISKKILVIEEKDSAQITFTANDVDNDIITISTTYNKNTLTVTKEENKLNIQTNSVDEDVVEIVTINATSNNITSTQILTITIKNKYAPVKKPIINFNDMGYFTKINGETDFPYTILIPEEATSFKVTKEYNQDSLKISMKNNILTLKPLNPMQTSSESILINIVDNLGNESITTLSVEVFASVVWGGWQDEQMDYIYNIRQQLSATNEYSYIAEFYTEILENNGTFSEFDALKYKRSAMNNDYYHNNGYEYIAIKQRLLFLEKNILNGLYSEAIDVVFRKGVIDSYLRLIIENKGAENYEVVKELSEISNGLLPVLEYNNQLNEYDGYNHYYSYFTNNESYGSYENDLWKFHPQYQFLQAVIEKTREQVEKQKNI